MNMGKALRVAQMLNETTNKKLSTELGIPTQMIHRWRYMKDMKISRAKQIADYFNMSLDELVRLGK